MYMGLENPSIFPLRSHVFLLMGFLFASAASDYWTLLLFTVAVSKDFRYNFYDITNGEKPPRIVIIFD